MFFLPIVDRELRRLARRRLTHWLRSGTALLAALIALGMLTVAFSAGGNLASVGRELFSALTLLAFGFALMAGPVLTADCLSEEKRLGTLGMLFLAVSVALWIVGNYAMRNGWLGPMSVFIVLYAMHATLKVWIAWEASRRFSEDRDSGALELLLCTPLRKESIWLGWLDHLKKRFVAPVAALIVIDWLLMSTGATAGGWWGGSNVWTVAFIAAAGLFIADTYTLSWFGLWQGLTARNPTRACLNCVLSILVLPATAALGPMGLIGLFTGTVPMGVVVAVWFGVGYLVDFTLCGHAMFKLNHEFRLASVQAAGRRGWDAVEEQRG